MSITSSDFIIGRILVVDDDAIIIAVLRTALETAGHHVLTASDGEQALTIAAKELPDLVLIDKNMPGLGGVQVMQRLKKASASGWTPVIMLSGDTRPESQTEALKLGCDDYLVKPVNLFVLVEKVAAFLRVQDLQRVVSRQNEELQAFRNHIEEESAVAGFLLERVMGKASLMDPNVEHWLKPSAFFSGDLLALARSPSGELYTLLADATGHGLPAAITLIPMTRMFQSMAERGFNLRTIAVELNQLVQQYTPVDRFVAASLACFNPRERTLAMINAGNPPALLVAADGTLVRKLSSQSVALGILEAEYFQPPIELTKYEEDHFLILFSDGLPEATNAEGESFGQGRIYSSLRRRGQSSPLQSIQQNFEKHMQKQVPHDDVSMLVVNCPIQQISVPVSPHPAASGNNWYLEFILGAQQLKAMDVVPMVVETARSMGLSASACAHLHTVLSELYGNALEHGLLHLDSALKEGENGFEQFMQERQRRLQALVSGEVQIRLDYRGLESGLLHLRVRDNGSGFLDAASVLGSEPALSGRGLALVYSLCQSVHYLGCGNEVEVELRCD